jgi:ethanolamine ammonia-lyase small subunit
MSDFPLPVPPGASGDPPPVPDLADLVRALQKQTPARILVGRAGPSYRTRTQLELRRDHAAALDAVHAELDLERDFSREFVARCGLFEVCTRAGSKAEFLMRPDLGRCLGETARAAVAGRCRAACDLQVVIGDGLSAAAVAAQVPPLLPLLEEGARARGWSFSAPFVIRHCRVGVLNDIGELLDPAVVVLLIGERPGLATAESLSAYLAYRPRLGDTDARRNLISNIHARGVPADGAARRVLALVDKMRQLRASGVDVKEDVIPVPQLGG